MRMTATRRFHASDMTGPDGRRTVDPGEEFEVPDETGKQLLEKGLATETRGGTPSETSAERTAPVGSATDTGSAGEKAEPDLPNKAEPTPKKKRRPAAEEPEE